MIKHRGIITMLCTILIILLSAGVVLGAPDVIIVQDKNYQVVQYRVDDALESQVLMNDMMDKLENAFENGYSIIGITGDNLIIDLNSGLESVDGYVYYENGVADGSIPEGSYFQPDFFAELAEDGSVVLNKPTQAPGSPQIDVGQWIGSGYDVLNNGYPEGSNTAPKLAVDKTYLQKYVVNIGDSYTDSKTAISQKATEIYSSLNNSTDATYKTACFSGNVSVDYKQASDKKRNETLIKHFAIYRDSFVKLELPGDTDLVDHRTSKFSQHLADVSTAVYKVEAIDQLFRDYGTHIITGYDLGGRAELNYAFSNQASIETKDIEVAVKASYQGIGSSAKGSNRTKIENNMEQVQSYSDINIKLYGGTHINVNTIDDFKANYSKWIASVKEKPTMLNIPNIDINLEPLWELTGEPGYDIQSKPIANAIYNRFITLALERGIELSQYDYSITSNLKDFAITEILVETGKSKEDALSKFPDNYTIVRLNPDGHNRLELETNKGAGGAWIYIGYKMERFQEPDPDNPGEMIIHNDVLNRGIVDIAISLGKDKGITNYEHNGVDLNATVGGDYVYLNYLRYEKDTAHKYKLIKDISGYYTKHYTIPPGWRSPSQNHDLNRSVKGSDDIYLVIKQ